MIIRLISLVQWNILFSFQKKKFGFLINGCFCMSLYSFLFFLSVHVQLMFYHISNFFLFLFFKITLLFWIFRRIFNVFSSRVHTCLKMKIKKNRGIQKFACQTRARRVWCSTSLIDNLSRSCLVLGCRFVCSCLSIWFSQPLCLSEGARELSALSAASSVYDAELCFTAVR